MHKKLFAILPAILLSLGLFCLSAAAAPSQDELDGMTPYGLAAEPIPDQNGAAVLTFQVVCLGADLPGMEPGDDIYVFVEYKRGEGEWEIYNSYGSETLLDSQVDTGECKLHFHWPLVNDWDGAEPIYFRAYCEYMQYDETRTGLRSGYSNVAAIGIAGEGATEPSTVGIVPIPYEEPLAQPLPSSASAVANRLLLGIGLLLLLAIILVVIVILKKKKRA